jgi:hypothetical protein
MDTFSMISKIIGSACCRFADSSYKGGGVSAIEGKAARMLEHGTTYPLLAVLRNTRVLPRILCCPRKSYSDG